jgi:hypothetical protein
MDEDPSIVRAREEVERATLSVRRAQEVLERAERILKVTIELAAARQQKGRSNQKPC